MRHPVDHGARQRLLEAQRAEADALRKVQAAAKSCDAVRSRLATADDKLREAQRSLVRTSGAARAALLLGVEEATLRRELRRTEDTTTRHTTPPSSSGHIDAQADDRPRS